MKQKQVVIIGAGFGGIACARQFAKTHPDFAVTVIDKNSYHTIHSNLYELASAPEEITEMRQLKNSVALPLGEIFKHTNIKIVKGTVVGIDPAKQEVQLEHGSIHYDYLVSGLGAVANFYNIPGAESYAIPLQSPSNALLIRNKIEFALQAHRLDMQKDLLRVVVAGGGVAGVEVAAELQKMLDFISWKNDYPRHKVQTQIIEGTGQLVPGMDARLASDAQARLESLGVQVSTHRMIKAVDESFVEFSNGERIEYDCLIWTAGVKAASLPMSPAPKTARGDRVEVDMYFRVNGYQNIFALGDQGCHHDPAGNPVPGTATQAIDHGAYIADAIAMFARNLQPMSHVCKQYPMLIPLGGKWVIFKSQHFYLKGYIGYIIREMAWLRYFTKLVGLFAALRLISSNERLYSKND